METQSATRPYVTPAADQPLRLVSTVFRQEREDRARPGWHDLLVMTLHPGDLTRLLRGYDFARQTLRSIRARRLVSPEGDNRSPKFDLAIDLPVALHSSACADGSGWALLDCGAWTALPQAFPRELLGTPNPGVDWRSTFRTSLQVYQRHGIAMIRVETSEGLSDLPEYFQTEELPIESLRRWQKDRAWSDAVVLHEAMDYSGT